ncbi:hypothetical protein GY45DRAFT_1263768 [Cubamyces sp. BRFM 1775]|nr:hypothetical protein GY45DRAFT_1263768 [Cubamyces sp. BRFM 1775]
MGPPPARGSLSLSHTFATTHAGRRSFDGSDARGDQSDSPVILHVPYVERERPHLSPTLSRRNSPPLDMTASVRYSPYPSPLSSTASRFAHSAAHGLSSADISPTSSRPPVARASGALPIGETIKLPPIRPPSGRASEDESSFHLPPISSMDNLREAQCGEPMAVLRRLQESSDEPLEPSAPRTRGPTAEMLTQRRHSLAVVAGPVYRLSEPASSTIAGVSIGAGSSSRTHGGPRTPLSAVAALPSLSYPPLPRHTQVHTRDQPEQQPRSAVDHPEPISPSAARVPERDDRLTQSMPPSPYLDASRTDYRTRYEDSYRRPMPLPQERVLARHERPLSPPPSATSAGSSPSDPVRTSWRPW